MDGLSRPPEPFQAPAYPPRVIDHPSGSTSVYSPPTHDRHRDYQHAQQYEQPLEYQPHPSPTSRDDKRGHSGDPDDDDPQYGGGDDSKPRKKHKGRAVLSCGECKRRKVKCDRKIPCATCIARGQADRCAWDDPMARPEGQPFALATQYDEVIARLDRIEHFLDSLPSDLRSQAIQAGTAEQPSFSQPRDESLKPRPKISNELEDAVGKLESSAFPQVATPSPVGLQFLASAIDMVPSIPRSAPTDRHVEATTALTSILAPPLRFESATKAVSNGFDLCFSERDLVQQRDETLDKVYSLLPTPEMTKEIIGAYLEHVSWFYSILHPAAFLAEVERFEEMLRVGRQNEVDTAWLGIFFAVLALGLDAAQSISTSSLPFATKPETTAAWYAASLRLFHISNWPNQPQFRLVQLVALYGQYNLTSGGGTDMSGFLSYLAIGVRIAQKLRLHQLGNDPKTMPPDDPAFPKGLNSMKRQTAIRVFAILTFLDVVTANNKMAAYLIQPSQVTTPAFDNLNFDQLSATEWKTEPAPRIVWTDSSLELNKFGGARYMRLVFDRLVTNAKDFTYDTVLELDREMRVHLSTFPESMTIENAQQEEKNPKLRKQRYMSMSGAYSRLVRLHRPFLVTGFTNSRYRFSKDACLQSARKVITAHYNGKEFLKNLRIVHSHTLSAVIVIYSYIFHLVDTNAPISEIMREKETAGAAYEVFSTTQVTSPMLNKVIRHAVAIVSMLATAVEERQAQKISRTQTGPLESFAQVLRGIAKQLSLAQPPPPADASSSRTEQRPLPTPTPTSPSFSTSSTRTTSLDSGVATTPASSTYQRSPELFHPQKTFEREPIQSLPLAQPPRQTFPSLEGASPPDSAFAAVFLGDLGLSSVTRPGPDVYDLSWLEQSPPTTYLPPVSVPISSSPILNPIHPGQAGSPPMYPPPVRQQTPHYSQPHSHPHSQSFPMSSASSSSSSQSQLYPPPHYHPHHAPQHSSRGSASPRPSKGWFLDGIEGADALYSQIK
ncbi:hypothetical protein JCM11491_002007 [Sporobolomyces phaffii]